MEMENEIQTQSLTLHYWHTIFQCIGKDCPLTCCDPSRWIIDIDEDALIKYRNLNDEYSKTLKSAIDFDKARFLSKAEMPGGDPSLGHQCAMLTDEGLCNIVLHYGEDMLCTTCNYYPRELSLINNHIERYVDITCPVVSAYLLDDGIPMNKIDYEDISFLTETASMDENIFSAMLGTRDFLMDLFLSIDGFSAGKCYILISLANEIQSVIDKGNINKNSFDAVFAKYESEDTLASILEECERFYDDVDTRIAMLKLAIDIADNVFSGIDRFSFNHLDMLKSHLVQWQNSDILKDDFLEFYDFIKNNFPKLVDRYMAYRVYSNWIINPPKDFSKRVKHGYFTCLLMEIAAMSVWKASGNSLSFDMFAYVISCIDRVFSHSVDIKNEISEGIESIEKDMNYSIFLMPIY